jgi:ABC-type multidrug transport system ATPase subunit
LSPGDEPAVLAERATALGEGRPLFRHVSFALPAGHSLALLGQASAAAALLECLAGRRHLAEGRLRVLGLEPTRRWRLRGRRECRPRGSRIPATPNAPELLLLDRPERPSAEEQRWLREQTAAGMSVVLAALGADEASALADRAALLSRGRLVAEGEIPQILRRFRRLRFVNRLTESRTAFGTELDEFEAVRVRVRGWGIEAVVANFDAAAFDRLSAIDGVADAAAEAMTLAEIVDACADGG